MLRLFASALRLSRVGASVVGVALRRMVRDLQKEDRSGVIADVDDELQHRKMVPEETGVETETATKIL